MQRNGCVTMGKGTIAKGTILSGNSEFDERQWTIGSFIGASGIVETYEAAWYDGNVPAEYPLVAKIVPRGNGSLPVEFQFYLDNARQIDIDIWKRMKNLDNLGMPVLLGTGSHDFIGQNYKFIVIERYGKDLWSLFLENGRKFEEHTVYKIALQILSVLKYIHSRSYVHGDIRPSNIVVDVATQNQIYLVNYHFASRYSTNDGQVNVNNTTEDAVKYMSRDAHRGVLTRKGDVEALFYNIVQWLGLKFPWEENLKDSSTIRQQKENAFTNVEHFLKDWSKKIAIPTAVAEFMRMLAIINEIDKATYFKFTKILVTGLRKIYHVRTGNLEFSLSNVDEQILEDRIQVYPAKRRFNLPYIPKLGISVPRLARIISENCRHEGEVNLRNTGPRSLIQVIYKFIGRKSNVWQQKLANSWDRDDAELRTITKQLWASKAKGMTKSEDAFRENVYEEPNQGPSTSAQANTNELNCIISGRSISEDRFDAMSPRRTSSHEDPVSPDLPNTSSLSVLHSLLETRPFRPFKWDEAQRPISRPSSISRCHSSQDSRSEVFSPLRTSDQFLDKDHRQFASEAQPYEADGLGEQPTKYRNSTDLDDEQCISTYEWLDTWLEMKEPTLAAFGSVPSEPRTMTSQVQQVWVLLDDFRTRTPRFRQLANVLAKLPSDSADAQKLDRIQQRWRVQLSRLEERGRNLGEASLGQVREALQDVSSNLNKLSDRNPEEQLLRKVEILAGQLEAQRALLASAGTVTEELCQAFSDAAFNDLRTELRSVNDVYDDLQHRINVKKTEVEKSLSDGRHFDDSCKMMIVWLAKELDMSEKFIVSADLEKLQQQQQHCQLILGKETKVNELLKKGRDFLSRPQNVENLTLQQSLLDLMNSQWDRLKMLSLQASNRLQACVEHGDKYYEVQNLFLDWLLKAEDEFRHLRPSSLGDTETVLKELSTFDTKVRAKSVEFEQMSSLGEAFVGACDEDNDVVVKNELVVMKNRWDKLNNDLRERIKSLEDTAGRYTVFNECLSKLERRVEELTLHDSVREITDPNQLDIMKGMREEADSLRGPLEAVRQLANELVLKANEQGIDSSRLSREVDRVAARIESLKIKLVDSLNKLYEQKIASFEKDIKPTISSVQDQDVKPSISLPKINWTPGMVIDLSSDNEGDIDIAYDEKPKNLLLNTNALSGELIDLVSDSESESDFSTQQLGELLSEQLGRPEVGVHTSESQLEEALKNVEQICGPEKSLGKKKHAASDPRKNEHQKTGDGKKKRRKRRSKPLDLRDCDLGCNKKRITRNNSETSKERLHSIIKDLVVNVKEVDVRTYFQRKNTKNLRGKIE